MGRRPYQRYSRKWNRKCKTRDQFQTTPVEGGFNLLCGVTVNQILFKHLRLGVVFQIVGSLINALSLLASQIVSFISYPLSTILPRVPLQGPEPNLETRIRDLEQLCKELAASVQGLQKNFEQLTANGDSSRCCLNLTSSASSLVPTSTKSLSACLHPRTAFEFLTTDSDSSQNRLPLTLSSSFPAPPVCPPPPPPLPPPCFVVNAPPPPPPPPPPLGFLDSQVTLKKLPATEKKTTPKCKVTRPTISVEELRSVKLKKTPAVQKKERVCSKPFCLCVLCTHALFLFCSPKLLLQREKLEYGFLWMPCDQ